MKRDPWCCRWQHLKREGKYQQAPACSSRAHITSPSYLARLEILSCMSMIVHDADLQHMQRMGNPQMYPHTPAQQHAANPQHTVTSPSYLAGQEPSNTAAYGKQ